MNAASTRQPNDKVSHIDEVISELTRFRYLGKHANNGTITNIKERLQDSLDLIIKGIIRPRISRTVYSPTWKPQIHPNRN